MQGLIDKLGVAGAEEQLKVTEAKVRCLRRLIKLAREA
jgi:hypothetical protein